MATTEYTHTIDAVVTTIYNGKTVIGQTYAFDTGAGRRFVAEAHNWNGDGEDGKYDPITVDVYYEPESAVAEIERRARDAEDTTYDGHVHGTRSIGDQCPHPGCGYTQTFEARDTFRLLD